MRRIRKRLWSSGYGNRNDRYTRFRAAERATARRNGKGAGIKVARLGLGQNRRAVRGNSEASPQIELSIASLQINGNTVNGQRGSAGIVNANCPGIHGRSPANENSIGRVLPWRREISGSRAAIGKAYRNLDGRGQRLHRQTEQAWSERIHQKICTVFSRQERHMKRRQH